ncbi:hypothetical protein PWG71_28360 [Nocardiopsis sp. N85]|nr:hypothetical protein [Nocardiopsis sp. N85]MDE3725310.1 hypothetical protein [Nocardiopsis sp. N85]
MEPQTIAGIILAIVVGLFLAGCLIKERMGREARKNRWLKVICPECPQD